MKKILIVLTLLFALFVNVSFAEAGKQSCKQAPPLHGLVRVYRPHQFRNHNWCKPAKTPIAVPTQSAVTQTPVISPDPDIVILPPMFYLYDSKEEMMNIRMRIQ